MTTEDKAAEQAMEQERIEWEEKRRRWEEQHLAEQREEAHKNSRKQLLGVIENWSLATRIEAFFASIQARISDETEESKQEISYRLERARQMFGGVNALNHFARWSTPEEHLAEEN